MWETLASTVPHAPVPLVVDGIQRALENRTEQYLATVALALSFGVVVWIIYRGGRPLKRRFSDELVDVGRTLTIMAVALATAAIFVVIWQAEKDVQNALVQFSNALVPGAQTAINLFVAFIALLGTYTVTRMTKRMIRHWSESGRISPHQRELAHHAVQIGLFFVAITFIFVLFDRNPRDLFLGAGVLGVVVGFAARKTLSGVLSGFVILFARPFSAGDWIAVGDRQGIVTEITIFNTQIRTFNEEHVLVPNDRVTDQEVINYSKTDRLRLVTEVGVDYETDIQKAASIAKETMEACESVAETPGPDVILDSFGDSAVVLLLRYWIDKPTIQRKLSAQNEVIDEVKGAFESEDIKIPFPQRELMGREETDGLRVASDADVSVGDEVERAFRRVGADSTAVREPVEERYRADTADEGREDGGAAAADGAADDEEEAETDTAASDDGSTDGRGDGGESAAVEASADDGSSDGATDDHAQAHEEIPDVVEETNDVLAPPRERFEDVDEGAGITEPVEEEYRTDDPAEGEQPERVDDAADDGGEEEE